MTEQRRKHLRLPLESTTFIELMSPRAGDPEAGRLVSCKSLNVFRGGLQVSLGEQLTVGAILQIGIDLPGSAETLYLAGEVRWCLVNKNEHHPWIAGFQILNANDSDIDRWVEYIVEMERQSSEDNPDQQ
jgi:hypothetical protein